MKQLTPEQLSALKQFARIEGRNWKSVLRQAWMNGDYGVHGDISNFLQQIRNSFGPSWLVRFKLTATAVTNRNHDVRCGLPDAHEGGCIEDPDDHDYEVIVGNIGSVYAGNSPLTAQAKFATYKEQSISGVGRAGGEPVTIMRDGEPMSEFDYEGTNEDEEEDEEDDDDEPTGPDEDSIATTDDRNFYQYGKLVLSIGPDDDRDDALVAYMNEEQFWPDCWSISDHGNPHLIDLTEAYARNPRKDN